MPSLSHGERKFSVIIPARYESTRFPGKPLRNIAGSPMIQHVYQRAIESGAETVVIATDDERIAETARKFGAQVCMTSSQHTTGTDRIAEAIDQLHLEDSHIVVNLQGDEPLMPPTLIHQVAEDLSINESASVSTLGVPINTARELFTPDIVKVVMDSQGYALYFSRAPIPWDRDAFARSKEHMPGHAIHYRHLGLYAYRCGFLRQYVNWPTVPVEMSEALEQLRILWNGQKIHVTLAEQMPAPSVDTEEDLLQVEAIFHEIYQSNLRSDT